jgi:hypothetical protein
VIGVSNHHYAMNSVGMEGLFILQMEDAFRLNAMMAIFIVVMDALIIAKLSMDTNVKIEIRNNQMFVRRYVGTDSTLVFYSVMMVIRLTEMVVIKIARSKEVGIVLEVLPLKKIHAMRYAMMVFFSLRIILAMKRVKVVLIIHVKQFQDIFAMIYAVYSILYL